MAGPRWPFMVIKNSMSCYYNLPLSCSEPSSRRERDWVLGEFKAGRSPILIATDVASRGLGTCSSEMSVSKHWCSCIHIFKASSGYRQPRILVTSISRIRKRIPVQDPTEIQVLNLTMRFRILGQVKWDERLRDLGKILSVPLTLRKVTCSYSSRGGLICLP